MMMLYCYFDHSLEEARENLEIITNTSREFGLEINREKSNILIFNMKEQPDELMGIQVVQSIKYLGIEIDNKRNYFKTHREKIIQKARKMANLTHCVIEKSCNKLLVGKTYWKTLHCPQSYMVKQCQAHRGEHKSSTEDREQCLHDHTWSSTLYSKCHIERRDWLIINEKTRHQ